MKKLSPKNFSILAILVFASLNLASCGSGGQDANENVTEETSAQKTPALEFCERSENTGNVYCQWVASAIKIEFPGGAADIELEYDTQGRAVKMSASEKGVPSTIVTLAYDNVGLRFQENLSNPDPNDPKKFLDVDTKNLTYKPDGTLLQIKTERKTNGILASTKLEDYLYGVQAAGYSVLIMTRETDGAGTATFSELKGLRKDDKTGKILVEDRKTLTPGTLSQTYWALTTYTYDAQTGRLRSYRQERQDCAKTPCGASIAAGAVSTFELSYNEAGKLAAAVGSNDGDTFNNILPDGVADDSTTCSFGYNQSSAAPYAHQNPMMSIIAMQGPSSFDFDFRATDTFTTFSCPVTARDNMTMTFTQTRLWQAIGAPAPGGAES